MIHSTNYINTFIKVAEDCPVPFGEQPPVKGAKKTVAHLQFDRIINNPYKFTSDDIIFDVFAERNDVTESEYQKERELFFSKGQPCLRSSPLTKRYGWGAHFDEQGMVAIYPRESVEYEKFSADNSLDQVLAMRSKRK